MRAPRLIAALAGLLLAGAVAPAQQEMPGGKPSPEAWRRLAAMLDGGDGKLPAGFEKFDFGNLSDEQLKGLEAFARQIAANPQAREQFRKQAQEMVKQNPNLLKQLDRQRPGVAEELRKNDPALPKAGPMPKEGFPPKDRPRPGDPKPIQNQPLPKPFDPQFPQGGPPGSRPPNPADNREYQEMAKLWESAFGPLDDTPAVRQAMLDIFSGMAKDNPGGKPFWADWDLNGKGISFADWLKGMNGGKLPGWMKTMNLPKLFGDGGPKVNAPKVNLPTAPKLPSLGLGNWSLPSISLSGLGPVGMGLLIAFAVALVLFLVWKFAPQLGLARRDKPNPLAGLGPWPIDPRTIADRAALVRAFEYVSVLLCGDGARVWNHATIAEALRETVPAAAPFADPLARLYALARYTPQSDDLSPAAVAEARGYLCRLAGVPES